MIEFGHLLPFDFPDSHEFPPLGLRAAWSLAFAFVLLVPVKASFSSGGQGQEGCLSYLLLPEKASENYVSRLLGNLHVPAAPCGNGSWL